MSACFEMEKSWSALYWQKHKRVAPKLTKSHSEARGTHWICFLIRVVATWWITKRYINLIIINNRLLREVWCYHFFDPPCRCGINNDSQHCIKNLFTAAKWRVERRSFRSISAMWPSNNVLRRGLSRISVMYRATWNCFRWWIPHIESWK